MTPLLQKMFDIYWAGYALYIVGMIGMPASLIFAKWYVQREREKENKKSEAIEASKGSSR